MKNRLLTTSLAAFLIAANSLMASPVPKATGDNFSYYETFVTVNTTGQTPATWYQLFEMKDIPAGGYKTVHVFFSISDFPQLENITDKGNMYAYVGHNIGGNLVFYKDGSLAIRNGGGDFLVLEAPIIGTGIGVSIYGVSLPPGTVKMKVSAYLIK